MIKDEIFVVNQPKKTILSIIVFEESKSVFPLPKKVHENLTKLSEKSDLFFIVKGKSLAKLDLDKFSSLYEATGWIYTDSITGALFKAFQYSKNIFEIYASYTVWNSGDLDIDNMTKVTESLVKLTMADVKWPIFKYGRMESEELYEIYKGNLREKEPKDLPTAWYDKFWKKEQEKNDYNKYTTYKAESKFLFFKALTIGKFIQTWEDEDGGAWINTFMWDDPRYLLVNLCKHLGMEIQNNDIWNM